MEGFGKGKLFGWLTSLEKACRHHKMPRKGQQRLKFDEQNVVWTVVVPELVEGVG